MGAHRNRPDRLARSRPIRAEPAKDAIGKNHAPHPAQDRRRRVRQSRRHLDARRSGRGRRSGQQPAEQEQGERVALSSAFPSPLWGGAGGGGGREEKRDGRRLALSSPQRTRINLPTPTPPSPQGGG